MTTKNFFTVFSVIWGLYGLLFLFGTNTATDIYGTSDTIRAAMATTEGAPVAMATMANIKIIGGLILSAALMAFFARDARASYGRRGILVFVTLASLMFLVFNLMGLTAGGERPPIVWMDMIVSTLFFIGGVYFLRHEREFEVA